MQTCVIHLLRHCVPTRQQARLGRAEAGAQADQWRSDPASAATLGLEALGRDWDDRYPALVRLWRSAWNQCGPFLDYDVEIRHVVYSTNAMESLNARYRRAVNSRGHLPSEQAALRCLYLVTHSLDLTGLGRIRWAQR